jgi:hypothetical protein
MESRVIILCRRKRGVSITHRRASKAIHPAKAFSHFIYIRNRAIQRRRARPAKTPPLSGQTRAAVSITSGPRGDSPDRQIVCSKRDAKPTVGKPYLPNRTQVAYKQ